jgi:Uma2 family endonuclease
MHLYNVVMLIELPEETLPATLSFDREHRLTDDEYFDFCAANPDAFFERTPEGEIVIVPPAGAESDSLNLGIAALLQLWARKDGRGKAFGPTVQFLLPDGSGLSPDAAWLSKDRWESLSKRERTRFPHLVPQFIVEVMSPSDRLGSAKKKMRRWMSNGVELGWLIDGPNRTIYVYCGAAEPVTLRDPDRVVGEGPVAGFTLHLEDVDPDIW